MMKTKERKYTVLFVDDEPRITNAMKAIFRREYKVLVANSGAEALSILSEKSVDVIVTDQRMPDMLGNELLAKISLDYPQTMRVLLTGFMDKQAIIDSINEGQIYRFINKPWNNEELREIVADAAKASEIPVDLDTPPVPKNTGQTAEPSQPSNDNYALLMIEQTSHVRHQIRRFCQQNKIMIYGTQNIDQAVAAATNRKNIGVVIVELSVDPELAMQTINLLKLARPELIAIALTDQYDASTAVDLINQGQVYKYLAKPLDVRGFRSTIQTAFRRHNFLKNNEVAQRRYKVEKNKHVTNSTLQSLFGRLLNTAW